MVAQSEDTQNGSALMNTGKSANLKELVQARKADLEAQLKALDSSNIERLLQEREETAAKLAELDEKIAGVRRQLGLATPKTGRRTAIGAEAAPRQRMSSTEIRARVLKSLAESRYGLSQKEISERSLIPYGTVAAYLKANSDTFKTTGKLKGKRYFLK